MYPQDLKFTNIFRADETNIGDWYSSPAMYFDLPGNTKDSWVDKDYWASLDILEGEDKGKSVLFKLHPTREASIQPEWCFTAGGNKYDGKGITCLKDGLRKELRFKANIQWAADAPEVFNDRNFSEHPDVPGDGGQELLDKVRLVIYKE